ncbi:hypothetical protein N7474_004448 [Penicillium riverlandense]|uniref:uncharacterized protein n=1 Tax=Penicillium riverlandense TaxID=1903569 RepID=UPI0025484B35|nr:uncharacterized protein N7474_004448 [Penicillium riverlandense]KAJ5818857.1 hypothetical protein N7474_004448 [Penicillium riverlandense]
MSGNVLSFRLFGGLRLEEPTEHLNSDELVRLNHLLTLIQELDHRTYQVKKLQPTFWDMNKAFEQFAKDEVQWWSSRDVNRPREFLVRPSGSLNALIACHLFNPTFCVADPYVGITCDLSNPSMSQIHTAGFTTDNSFFFDHISRRDMSHHVGDCYPQDLCDIHDSFLFALRNTMGAVVEVRWGSRVRERMKNLSQLVPLTLWGQYKDVTLHLELSGDKKSLKRFLLFVRHPQCYAYVESSTERAQAFRTRNGRKQDLLLKVAAHLANIQIEPHFYEYSPRLIKGFRETAERRLKREMLQGQARAQLRATFPNAILVTEKKLPRLDITTDDRNGVSAMKGFRAGLVSSTINPESRGNLTVDKVQRELRLEIIADLWNKTEALAATFLPGFKISTQVYNAYLQGASEELFTAIEQSDWTDIFDWDELPEVLISLLENQSGLRTDGQPISSREHLERAYCLLQAKGDPGNLGIVALAFCVLVAYGWKISRSRKASIDSLLVLQASPRNIVPRKCFACKRRVLDDPFAYYAESDPTFYVVWSLENSCGLPGCPKPHVQLVPFDSFQSHIIPLGKELLGLPDRPRLTWQKVFLRSPEEYGELPRRVEVDCGNCGAKDLSVHPRWTTHEDVARYLVEKHKCGECGKKSHFKPTDSRILTISDSALVKLWKSFMGDG